MSLKQQISDDMKTAMRAKETARLGTIRLLLSAIKQREIDERIELTDTDVLTIIEKMCKQRRESITQYQAAERSDLVETEQFELNVLLAYLPQQLDDESVEKIVSAAVSELGAAGPKDMGRVMAVLRVKLAGQADMSKVSAILKTQLTQ